MNTEIITKNIELGGSILEKKIRQELELRSWEFGESEQKALNRAKELLLDCYNVVKVLSKPLCDMYIDDYISISTQPGFCWRMHARLEGVNTLIRIGLSEKKYMCANFYYEIWVDNIKDLSKREFEEKDFEL